MTDSHAQRVAAHIRVELAMRRFGQHRIAALLGISQAAVSRRLRGEVPFDVAELGAIADALDVPMAHLLPERRSA